jgi:hypothetical protein
MTDAPTDKKLSERFAEFVQAWKDGGDPHEDANTILRMGRFAIDRSDTILRALCLAESHPSAIREAVEGCADMAVVSGELPATLGNAVSDAIFAAIKRGMGVDEAVSVVVAVASDYGCNAYGESYRGRLAELVRAHRARGEEKGQ